MIVTMLTMENSTFLKFTIPLTARDREIARQFGSRHVAENKAEKVYRNTLAVLAVNYYCKCMGIDTDLQAGESWNPVMQTLSDAADLCLCQIGKVECRPVSSDASAVEIPPEVWGDRVGYLAVKLSASGDRAELLGFVENVNSRSVSLQKLRSLDDFLERIDELERAPVAETVSQLSNWFKGIFEAGWEAMDRLERHLNPPQAELSFSFRNRRSPVEIPAVERGKWIDLKPTGKKVALCVGIGQETASEVQVYVELFPQDPELKLPRELLLAIVDEGGKSVMQAEACGSESLRFEFSGESGEFFGVQIIWQETILTEKFSI